MPQAVIHRIFKRMQAWYQFWWFFFTILDFLSQGSYLYLEGSGWEEDVSREAIVVVVVALAPSKTMSKCKCFDFHSDPAMFNQMRDAGPENRYMRFPVPVVEISAENFELKLQE